MSKIDNDEYSYDSFFSMLDVKATLHTKSGDINLPFGSAKKFIEYVDARFTYIRHQYTFSFGDYYILNNKILQIVESFAFGFLHVDIYELNEIDAVYWMSGCINIKDQVYEIVDRDSDADIIYVKELDLA